MVTSNTPSYVFFGEFRHSLDGKNRVTIPSAWRRNETDEFFILPSLSQSCLTVMPREVHQRVGAEAQELAKTQENYRVFTRWFFSQAQQIFTDKAGRLLVPETFCTTAGLSGETILAGCNDRFEIWNPANWTQIQQASAPVFTEVAKALGL